MAIARTERSPVGVGSVGVRRRLAEQLVSQAEQSVLDYNTSAIVYARRGKLFFIIPAPGDKAIEAVMRGLGAELLGNPGRISARIRRTRSERATRSDIRHSFRRLEYGTLNVDGRKPLVEHLMSLIQTSRSLKSLEGLPAGIGSAINSVTSIGIPFLKLLTADSARSKVVSFIGNFIIGSVVSAFDAPLGTLAFYINGQRLESGLDLGDLVADVGGLLGYQYVLDHPDVPEKRKAKLAVAYLAEYNAVPREGRRTYAVAHRFRGPLRQASRAATTLSTASSALENIADIPGVGEVGSVARIVKSVAASSERPPRSMRDRVDEILEMADQIIGEQQATIQTHPRGGAHPEHLQLATWECRKAIATILHNLAASAEAVRAAAESAPAPGA